jgi:Leucine-rich repeat (LRR) protein
MLLSVIMPKRCIQRRRRAARMSSLIGLPTEQTRLQAPRGAQPFINADVLQIITEYTAQISSIFCQRRVSKRWHGAVTEAIGFLNGRDWKCLAWWSCHPQQLFAHFTDVNPGAIARFMVVCLRERLEKLVIYSTRRDRWSLRLLGERNACLKHLRLHCIDVRDVAVLGRCSALEEVLFDDCTLDVRDVTAFVEMPALKELSLTGCQPIDLSLLYQCKSLLSLNLDSCQFVDNGSVAMLAQIAALTSLSLSDCSKVTNVSPLSSCLALEELILNRTRVDEAGIKGLERIPTLRKLYLRECRRLPDVTWLEWCARLEKILYGSPMTIYR